jgi:hypothetical protein
MGICLVKIKMLSHGIYLMVLPEAQKSCLYTALKFVQHVHFLDQLAKHVENVDVL